MSNTQWLSDVAARLQNLLPQLLAAAALIVAGWLLGLVLRFLTVRLLTRFVERAGRTGNLKRAVDDQGVRSTIPKVVGGFVFWVTLLFFVSAAIEALGFPLVTDVVHQVAYYLPNVLVAIVIVVAGLVGGRLARRAATAGARSAGVVQAERVGQALQVLVLVIAAVVAMDQVGVDAQLLVILLTVVTTASLGSAGLAFGLGARVTVGNIIASHYIAQTYRVGQTIRIGDIEGEIVQTTPTAVVLATGDGRMLIPARRFSEEPSLVPTQQ